MARRTLGQGRPTPPSDSGGGHPGPYEGGGKPAPFYEYKQPSSGGGSRGGDATWVWGSLPSGGEGYVPNPPVGRGGDPAYGPLPFGSTDQAGLSPEEARSLEIDVGSGVADRLRQARSFAPSARRQTQGEIINMSLLYGQLGNPFSVRRIPFSVLRDMITDPMLGFALYYTRIPLMKADWYIDCPDPQIAAAVDEALRPVNPRIQSQICGKLAWGYQPMCKRFKLGQLGSFYRDARAEDPEKDLATWPTKNVDALLWEDPYVLAPEHCMPRWNERGDFIGFYYSVVPIPNPIQIGVAALYGYTVVPGYEIPGEFAMWPVNERDQEMGSIFGSPRLKRAYRFWWSYWYRWALADRLFENCSDPTKIVYYPTDYTEGIDPEDPLNPKPVDAQQRALAIGEQARQGATLALPGDFMIDESTGRMSAVRKWAISYLEPHAAFEDLNKSFIMLDGLKFRCVTADTPVDCPRDHPDDRRFSNGIPISMLKTDDPIWVFNTETQEFCLRTVGHAACTQKDQQVFKVTLSNGKSIRATANHPFLTMQLAWKTLGELVEGDRLVSAHDSDGTSVVSIEPDVIEDVWDVSINAEDHCKNFIVHGAVLHNSMFLPEEAFVQPSQGQRAARNVATQLGELYQESTQQLADENDEEINNFMIPQFVAANFPDRAATPCRKVTQGTGTKDADILKQVLTLVGQVKGEVLPVDIRELLRQMGLPLMSEQQQKLNEAQIAKEAAASAPPEMQPGKVGMQGNNSGVGRTPQGTAFYYAGPERIDLSTSHQGFLADLPDVPAYKDASVRASMMRMRKLFLDRYKERIDSFVEHLRERTTLRLAQQATQTPSQQTPQGLPPGTAAGVAASVIGAWAGTLAVDTVPATAAALLLAIATRAGLRELKAVNLGSDAFDPAALEAWARARAAFIVQSVDSTLADELTTFLTDELQRDADPEKVADAAEARFADTAQTHADRVIGAEALPAYNRGALTAFRDAGVAEVQAHDASDGRDQLTDPECKSRNGVVLSVQAALIEAESEHPHGTLWFSPLSTDNLTVERVEVFPPHLLLNGDASLHAFYDDDSETLFVLEEVSEEAETEYRLAIGSALALTG